MSVEAELTVPSSLENVDLVQAVLEETMSRLAVDDKISYAVGMAVREAVVNAIEHGNDSIQHKKVALRLEVADDELVVTVTDEGNGFDLEEVPDPCAPLNLMQTSGRGLLFMKEFMDEIDYTFHEDGGTEVRLTKRYSSDPGLKEDS